MSERDCIDCGVDSWAIHEDYMVTGELWAVAVGAEDAGRLCIGCLENRIGRQLSSADFTDCPINTGRDWPLPGDPPPHSRRLEQRLAGVAGDGSGSLHSARTRGRSKSLEALAS